MGKFIDLTGQVFGRLTVISRAENSKNGGARWNCVCECSGECVVAANNLKNKHTQSCACYQKAQTSKASKTHGDSGTRLYEIYNGIKKRCYNPNTKRFADWGGRGIIMCDEWLNSFEAFKDWALVNGYNDTLSIDRIDNNGNYEPNNCNWSSPVEQNNNKRTNIYIELFGTTHTVTEWCRQFGFNHKKIRTRLRNGWHKYEAFEIVQRHKTEGVM